jgi:hypothetical protein
MKARLDFRPSQERPGARFVRRAERLGLMDLKGQQGLGVQAPAQGTSDEQYATQGEQGGEIQGATAAAGC